MGKDEAAVRDRRAVLRVNRAIADLRQGQIVRIEHPVKTCLVASAETAPGALAELAALAGQRPGLVITLPRATVLGLAAEAPLTLRLPAGAEPDWIERLAFAALGDSGEALALLQDVQAAAAEPTAAVAVQLAKFARLLPAVLWAPLESRLPGGDSESLVPGVSAEDILAYPGHLARTLRQVSDARVPLAGIGASRFVLFRAADGMTEHLAVIVGEPALQGSVLVRLHSACLTGDIFGSLKCDCGEQLRSTIQGMAEAGGGVLLYLAQEGRDIGLANKLRAYRLQAAGYDTLDADAVLGFEHDERRYEAAAEMLRQLGVERVRLLTNNPRKLSALEAEGIPVDERIPVLASINPFNACYLHTKANRAGHLFEVVIKPDAA